MILRTIAYDPFNIPSGSMKPTLLVGDYLFVSKFSYGYSRYSIPLGLPLFKNRILLSEPKRGDIAVFKLPSDNSTNYIKRVIGLPGDEIQVIDGALYINNKEVLRERVSDYNSKDRYGNELKIAQFKETLPNGISYFTFDSNFDSIADNTPMYKVSPGHYFMMGDNRDDSADSRFAQVGQVPLVNFVGKAEILFFSLDNWKIRFNRILMLIR